MKIKSRLDLLASRPPPGRPKEELSLPEVNVVESFTLLQEKMAHALGLEAASADSNGGDDKPLDASVATLPFINRDYTEGELWQRLERQGSGQLVGRISTEAARRSSPSLLSLLALDPALADVDLAKAVYFDTETTGLGGAGTLAFLIGFAWFDEDGALILEQLLLKDPGHESAQLARVSEIFAKASLLVSFNGKSFDWPLLQTRCVMNHLPRIEARPHLDLLHVARRLHKHRLSRCRLVDLESEILDFERGGDDIPGAEIPPLYGHFLRTGDEGVLRPVVEHNAWDVLTMVALVSLYGESFDDLSGADLLGLTETLTRARSFDAAVAAADRALEDGGGSHALLLRARIHKARGDKARALLDFESLSAEVDDEAVRLELAKLFEHHAKDFTRALSVVGQGTGEEPDALEKRRLRLLRRRAKQEGAV